ncbi:MAG: DUF58 domain-containing protein [Bacteroidota bacterium]|nr:DUF58 domain-containing protein [Bacteroidota bacterium]
MKFYKSIFFHQRLYWVLFIISALFVFGYYVPLVFVLAKVLLLLFSGFLIADILLLYSGHRQLECSRDLPLRMSMNDPNEITLSVRSNYFFAVNAEIIDELPFQFQIRDFLVKATLNRNETKQFTYHLTPKERGEFEFGDTQLFVLSMIGLVKRRFTITHPHMVPVYPSFVQMRKFELLAKTSRVEEGGVTKVRKAGKHTEFDQIREYVSGDDYRLMNWKATARRAHLMVNQYQEEQSKDIYSIIDMGRVMMMPFEGMTLLDYAINASLAISNISVYKHDKAGLITFSTNIDAFIPAEKRNNQMTTIQETLYNLKTGFLESNYEMLYLTVKKRIRQRSLLILYTNFESLQSMNRQLPFLQNLARHHLVLVVVFMNTEVDQLIREPRESLEDVYTSVIAGKFIYEKKLIVKELQKYGINTILTTPQNLTINLINKYLEFKAGEKI